MPVSGPTVVRRQLGRRLQRLREATGKTVLEVEAATGISRTKLWRVERGQVPVKQPDVWALCRYYEVDAAQTDILASLAQGTADQGWWEDYSDVIPDWFQLYVGLESAATSIFTFEDSVVPGELQTAGYIEAVYRGERPDEDGKIIERHVRLRQERQEALFGRVPAPVISVVLGQNVLTRSVGGPAVLAAQIERLRDLDRQGRIDLRVLTFDSGAHPAMAGAFRILDFEEAEDPDVVYLEGLLGARYLEEETELQAYRRVFDLAYRQAVPIREFPR